MKMRSWWRWRSTLAEADCCFDLLTMVDGQRVQELRLWSVVWGSRGRRRARALSAAPETVFDEKGNQGAFPTRSESRSAALALLLGESRIGLERAFCSLCCALPAGAVGAAAVRTDWADAGAVLGEAAAPRRAAKPSCSAPLMGCQSFFFFDPCARSPAHPSRLRLQKVEQ